MLCSQNPNTVGIEGNFLERRVIPHSVPLLIGINTFSTQLIFVTSLTIAFNNTFGSSLSFRAESSIIQNSDPDSSINEFIVLNSHYGVEFLVSPLLSVLTRALCHGLVLADR